MKVNSDGLGRTWLTFRLESISSIREIPQELARHILDTLGEVKGDERIILGKVTEPFEWELRIVLTKDDIPMLLKIAFSRETIKLFLLYILSLMKLK